MAPLLTATALPTTRRRVPPWPAVARRSGEGLLLATLTWIAADALRLLWIAKIPPLAGLPLVALAGGVLGLTRLRWVPWAAAAALTLLVVVVAYTPAVVGPARALVRADLLDGRRVDAVVVLSSSVSDDGLLDGDGVDRLLSGLTLLRRGVAPVLVVSRLRIASGDTTVTSDADQGRLIALGGGEVPVLVADSVHSTRDEAVRVAAIARRERWRTVALVTSPLHSSRACATFERTGLAVVCAPSEERAFALRRLASPRDRLRAFPEVVYERLARLKYRRQGWI